MTDAAQHIADVTAAVIGTRAAVLDGAWVDLAGLADEVAAAMAKAREAPPSEGAALAAAMKALIGELDGLAAVLARQHHAAAQQRAAAAYGRDGTGQGS